MEKADIGSIREYSVSRLRDPRRVLNHLDLVREKRAGPGHAKIGLLEFHPSNRCSLSCFYCTYRRPGEEVYPFSQLDKLAHLSPRAVVLTGGGEVTEYVSGRFDFADLVDKMRDIFPDSAVGVTTNGQYIPGGDWQDHISWLRVSIDAADSKTFLLMKGAPMERLLKNLCDYINGPIPRIGAGFVYNRFNIREVGGFLRRVLHHVLRHCGPAGIEKLNFQFRPTCLIESCDCPSANYRDRNLLMVPDKQDWWHEFLDEQRGAIFSALDNGHWYSDFLRQRTNLDERTLFAYDNTKPVFRRCYLALIRAIVRPNGDVYPCVMRASNFCRPIANILRGDDVSNVLAAQQQRCFLMKSPFCSSHEKCCRVDGKKNIIIEEALDSAAPAGKAQEPADWFF